MQVIFLRIIEYNMLIIINTLNNQSPKELVEKYWGPLLKKKAPNKESSVSY